MKNKHAAAIIGMAFCLAALTGCGGDTDVSAAMQEETETLEETESTSADEGQEEAEETEAPAPEGDMENRIYGEVVSVEEDSITIAVGTMAGGGPGESRPDEAEGTEAADTETADAEAADTEAESTETEDTETADTEAASTDTEDTESESTGAEEGEAPEEGTEPPSMLELTGEEQTISITQDTVIQKQSMGRPEGENGEAPEIPDGENGEAPELSGEENEETSETSGEESEETPEIPDEENGEAPEKPEGENGKPGEPMGEEISWEDLAEGDVVVITLDEDGNAASVTLMSMEMEQPEENNDTAGEQ